MIELMVVVVIIGILAAVAIPVYSKYIKASRLTEATTRIGEIVTAARSWAIENPNASGRPIWPSGSVGLVDLSEGPNFTYSITAGAGTNANNHAFRIRAVGKAGTPMRGVRVVVRVPDIDSNAEPPVVTGL